MDFQSLRQKKRARDKIDMRESCSGGKVLNINQEGAEIL